jgi:hypothetical protein
MMYRLMSMLAVVAIAGSANAAMIIQQDGTADVKFEAGSYDSLVNNGSSVVVDNGNGTLTTTGENGGTLAGTVVTYQINFATAGNYFLYFEVTAPSASADSVFVNHATGFNSTPSDSNPERWNGLDTGWNGLLDIGIGLGTAQGGNYTVPAGSPAYAWSLASPGTVSFAVRSREDGLTWNSFVFSTSDTETGTDLDNLPLSAVVIPEPGSLALVGLGSLMLLGRRRQA